MRVILAGPEEGELTGAAYPAFTVAGMEVAAVATAPETLAELAGALPDAVAVVQADLYPTVEAAVEGLGSLPCRVSVVLPVWWEGERERFAGLSNLVAGFTAPVSWAQVAAEVKTRAQRSRGAGGRNDSMRPCDLAPRRHAAIFSSADPPAHQRGAGRVVAVWSGPAGGVGKTTLALLLAGYAAEREANPLLLALAEPGVSARLGLPRVPNVGAFFGTGDLAKAAQQVGWEGGPAFPVVLGPARPWEGAVEQEQVAALVGAAAAAYPLVVADLPALPPGGNAWSLEPLRHARNVVLVVAPTSVGVAAAVEGLAALRAVGASGRVVLAVNRRGTSGLPLREFVEGVRSLWGACPEAVEVPYTPDLAAVMDRGELPDEAGSPLWDAVAELAEAALGLPRPEGAAEADRPRRRLGRLISVEVVD